MPTQTPIQPSRQRLLTRFTQRVSAFATRPQGPTREDRIRSNFGEARYARRQDAINYATIRSMF